jgi:hypothetical protein
MNPGLRPWVFRVERKSDMPFKMIANHHVYRADEKKEYKKGESFTVKTETEKNRLLRNKRARLDDTPAPVKPVERTPIAQKVMVAEESAVHPSRVVQPDMAVSTEPMTPRQNRYRRSDLRSED